MPSRRWRPARTCSSRSRSPKRSRKPSASSRPRSGPSASWSIGYILRHHPSWMRFIELARTLGHAAGLPHEPQPAVERRAVGDPQAPAAALSPIVDCGVHYVDIWCQITPAKPVQRARGRRAADRRPAARDVQLRPPARHVRRRVGRLVRGRLGTDDERDRVLREGRDRPEGHRSRSSWRRASRRVKSDDINAHTQTNQILLHHAALDADGTPAGPTNGSRPADEPGHDDSVRARAAVPAARHR